MQRRTFFAALAAAGSLPFVRTAPAEAAGPPSASAPLTASSPAAPLDLKSLGRADLVKSMRLSGGAYSVTTQDGGELRYSEPNLRIKTDTSPKGPPLGAPALIKGGMGGDRAYVVFASPREISKFIEIAD